MSRRAPSAGILPSSRPSWACGCSSAISATSSSPRRGLEYAEVIREAFDRIELRDPDKTQSDGKSRGPHRSFPTVAMKWLVGRLSRFHALHPDINVQVTIAHDLVDVSADEIDFTIQIRPLRSPASVMTRCFRLNCFPSAVRPSLALRPPYGSRAICSLAPFCIP